jgi:hypothetical protein
VRTLDVARDAWDMPVEWWDETPSWLYDLAPYLKTPLVKAFSPFVYTIDRGWRFELWMESGVRARYHIENGGVRSAGTAPMRTLPDVDWYRIDPLEDPAIGELPEDEPEMLALRLHEPAPWRLGQWGWAVPRDGGVVTGVYERPGHPDVWEGRKLADELVHCLGHGHGSTGLPSEIALIAPDGQTRADSALFRRVQDGLDAPLVRVTTQLWWEQTAGMPAW